MQRRADSVVFGHMHEDHSTELALVSRLPCPRALVIASGGDLAFSLIGVGIDVLAVDSNPAQIELVQKKLDNPNNALALCACGRVNAVLRWAGPMMAWLLDWPRCQPGWSRKCITGLMERLLGFVVTLIHGKAAAGRLNRDAIRLLRTRLEAAIREPEAASNSLLQVLMGNSFEKVIPAIWSPDGIACWRKERSRLALRAADLGQVLAETDRGSYGLISVSNLPDAMDAASWQNTVALAQEALAPGGFLVVRSMLQDHVDGIGEALFATGKSGRKDRSPLCPVVWVGKRILQGARGASA